MKVFINLGLLNPKPDFDDPKEEIGMQEQRLRPRYKFTTEHSPKNIIAAIDLAIKMDNSNPYGLQRRSSGNHLIVVLPKKHKHFWSPTLDINFEPLEGGKTRVRVLIGPEPSIWTMFMFLYTIGGLMAALGFVLGYSKYLLGHETWLFYLIPAGIILDVALYLAGLAGKNKAQSQMRILKKFFEDATGVDIFHED